MKSYDIAIIGAGIAGASVASEIADQRSVLLLEAEDQPGYHSTGRSAAFWTESYGGPQIQPLTTASRLFLEKPPKLFFKNSFLKKRGAINIARTEDRYLVDSFVGAFVDSGVAMSVWNKDKLKSAVPHLKPEWDRAVFEPDCCDIDVAALHAAYLKSARKNGMDLKCNARVTSIGKTGDIWEISCGDSSYLAKQLVNAAGAWADDIARIAGVKTLAIQPMRRTLVQLLTDPLSSPEASLVVALDGSFYFKPETGGEYWLSPHDETPVPASDVAAEEMDVALAIDRFQQVLDVNVVSVTRKWAGLRSFAPDRLPVYGFDPAEPDFFWFAGQGGFGIQTAPAAAMIAKSLLLDIAPDKAVEHIDFALYDPARFT